MTDQPQPVSPPRPNWPATLARADVDHVVVVLSDIEIGAGGPTDDFPQSAWLGQLLLGYCAPPFADVEVTVVFNGDTFDFLKTPLRDGSYPIHISATEAVEKATRVFDAHTEFLAAIARFGAYSGAKRTVRFTVGNHDGELYFPSVRRALRQRIGAFTFDGLGLNVGDMHIEHGHQNDPMFRTPADAPFVSIDGRRVLNLPWGALALLEVAMPLHPQLYPLDRIRPREEPMVDLSEVKELLLGLYWDYWTAAYWQHGEHDPLHRVSWTMVKQIIYRFGTHDADVPEFDPQFFHRHSAASLIVVGHRHIPAWWEQGRQRILQSGCFRNEFFYDRTNTDQLIPSVYAEAYQRKGVTRRSHLVEVDVPPPPRVPGDLGRLLPAVRALLAEQPTSAERQAQQTQAEGSAQQKGGASSRFMHTLRETVRRRVINS